MFGYETHSLKDKKYALCHDHDHHESTTILVPLVMVAIPKARKSIKVLPILSAIYKSMYYHS